MKKLIFVSILLITSTADAAVLCQSSRDVNYRAWFEGYSCPSGFYLIRAK